MSAGTNHHHHQCITSDLTGSHGHSHNPVAPKPAAAPIFPPSLRVAPPPKWQTFAFASVAATIASPFTNPFAVAKTQLQVQKGTGSNLKYTGMVDFMRKAAASDGGLATLQRGLAPVMIREGIRNLFRIGLYQPVLGQIHDPDDGPAPVYKRMIAGAASGACGAVACNPFEIVRIRVQAQALETAAGAASPLGPRGMSSLIFRNEGMRGFYKAGMASVALGMVCTSVNLTSYTLLHEMSVHKFNMKDGPIVDSTCALASGFLATLAMNPVDVTRTRLMTQPSPPIYRNGFDAVKQIFLSEGPSAFMKGFFPSFCRVGPHFVLTFLLLEQMRRFARKYNEERGQRAYLTSLFEAIDADKSGEIDRGELEQALLEADPLRDGAKAKEETDFIFSVADQDGSGEIDLDEFVRAAKSESPDHPPLVTLLRGQQLLATFRSIDLDGNGTIDEDELLAALRAMRDAPGSHASKRQVDEFERSLRMDVHKIMTEVDEDGDRTIDFGEFARAYDKMGELEEHRLFEQAVKGPGVGMGN
eukprot:CAMPEP_0113578296 /NCGR_PEP_ID=MMETSP0015_2-20120614/29394_1 /TAXON_ID=2838 /ORGANISM="Odontella" /LENGTH=529 /DNA_ID=CAMNT_0000482069 /DNA_START=179 /DNA_END=1768 /DNA_ORIENTATION=- /assembly_acc=CAM_ASM_000160